MSNLDLWDSVKTTDPEFTKEVKMRGGFTSISPQYQIMQATEQFGSYGSGWGFISIDLNLDHIEALGVVMVKAVFFYTQEGTRHTFPINNSWSVKSGSKVDDDFAKKAETNTMSKALSKLGFSADIFMGQFDNPDYVKAITNEFDLEKAEDKIEEGQRQLDEYQLWVESSLELTKTCQSQNELKKLFTGQVRKAQLYKDQATVQRFNKAKDERKLELEAKDDKPV